MLFFAKSLFLFPLFGWITAQTENTQTIKSVQILFRHGTREPDDGGFEKPTGHLKQIGKKEMYDLGIFLRQRYNDLIKIEYDESEISVVSSDVDRTIQSGYLVAYGLYQDFNLAATWNNEEKIQYEPIPVRTIPKKYDKYLQMLSDCPRRAELQDQALDPYYGRFLQENRDLVDYYAMNSGDQTIRDTSLPNQKRMLKIIVIQEELIMNKSSNLPLIDWAQPLLKNNAFLSIKTFANREMVETAERKKLFAGPLLKLLIENMEESPSTRKKMNLFSGHDRIIAILLFTLGIFDPSVYTMPPSGASFILELHEPFGLGARPSVQIWYRNETQNSPHFLEIPNCGTPCYLSRFKELTKEFIPVDYEADCAPVIDPILNSHSSTSISHITLIFSTLILSLLVVIGVFQIILIRRRNGGYDKL